MALITVSGHLFDAEGNPLVAAPVVFQIGTFNGNILTVSGTNIVIPKQVSMTTNSSGFFTGSIQGNDTISPSGTFYQVSFANKSQAIYLFTGAGPINLDSYAPTVIIPVASTPTAAVDILPLNNTFTGTNTFSGAVTLSGEGAAGNVVIKPFALDDIQYVSTSGNDTNDGLSWGTARATIAAAITTLGSNGIIYVSPSYAGANPASLPSGITIIDSRIGGTFPTGTDLLGNGVWINMNGEPEEALAAFSVQSWRTSPSTTSSAILGTNKFTGDLTAGGGSLAAGTYEVDTYGTLTATGSNIIQALTGQCAIRSLGGTLNLVTGVEGGGGIDRTTTTTNITTAVSVQGDQVRNLSTAGATITNAYGGRFIQSTDSGITNNNFAISSEGDLMFRVGDSIRIENGSSLATKALTFTSNTALSVPTGVSLTADTIQAATYQGGFPVTTVTANTTASQSAGLILCNSASAITITLPQSAAQAGARFTVKNINTGVVTVVGASGNTDGAANFSIPTQYQTNTFSSDGTNYWII